MRQRRTRHSRIVREQVGSEAAADVRTIGECYAAVNEHKRRKVVERCSQCVAEQEIRNPVACVEVQDLLRDAEGRIVYNDGVVRIFHCLIVSSRVEGTHDDLVTEVVYSPNIFHHFIVHVLRRPAFVRRLWRIGEMLDPVVVALILFIVWVVFASP